MPKKTRQQKIAAEARKRSRFQRMIVPNERTASEFKHEKVTLISNPATTYSITPIQPQIENEEDRRLRTYFIHDVKKSLFLITGIVALEFIIYFGTINKYLASVLHF